MKLKEVQMKPGSSIKLPSGKGELKVRFRTGDGISLHLVGETVALVEDGCEDAVLFPANELSWAKAAAADVMARVNPKPSPIK